MQELDEITKERYRLQGSFLEFFTTFFYLRNNRNAIVESPPGRECHIVTICKELTKVFYHPNDRLIINIPPGHFKSTLLCYWICWCFSHYSDCKFLYIAHSVLLAEKNTAEIKAIMSLPTYKQLFDTYIDPKSKARGSFHIIGPAGLGAIKAFGSGGGIVGMDAGYPGSDRMTGGVVYDDAHKPDDVHSDLLRQNVIDNYNQTVKPRPRSMNVPIIFLGQRLHEDDLPAFLLSGGDGREWRRIILKAIDDAGNALAPGVISLEQLRIEQQFNKYVFASQYQQDPVSAGNALFLREDFLQLEDEPKDMLGTFIVADTAETDKEYNDATVFSFFGVYEIPVMRNVDAKNKYAIHWIDCVEIRVEPKDLKHEFFQFWHQCCRYKQPPEIALIEKKSTGVTLISVLKDIQGLRILEVQRDKSSGSKGSRFIKMQQYIASKKVTFSENAKHYQMCVNHMSRITANNTHRHDDIADTLHDAIQFALIDRAISQLKGANKNKLLMETASKFGQTQARMHTLLQNSHKKW